MHIYFAGDHAGFEMKQELMEFVRGLGHDVEDLGPHVYDAGDDFPDYVIPLARKVTKGEMGERGEKGEEVRGIIVAASGQGEAMCANRIKGVRAVVYYGPVSMKQTDADGKVFDLLASTRQHNNANVLSLGARFMSAEEAKSAVRVFLETPFSNDERHVRRLKKIDEIDSHL
ncbi:MAG: RpiB/LacA/LacB family sugar-phosphate isomerase [bacterium]|nr:RpiB/LacA/LacB family sugar-phosphate isomerase [bacterium]